MKHGSLFSGIGGFDLAAQQAGWENIFHCEINPFCQRVLNYYWPNANSHADIKKTDFSQYRGAVDIVSGGFPCQPYSVAGKRQGKDDDRHLWPEMLRAIREIAPRWVVGENVRGLISWNGGMVFDEVQSDLEAEGYEVTPFLLPACAVNAPHRRDRIWFVAYSGSIKLQVWAQGRNKQDSTQEKTGLDNRVKRSSNIELTPDASAGGIQRNWPVGQQEPPARRNNAGDHWQQWPTQSPICGRNDGLPAKLDGITISKWRNESIQAYGNAVVPQLVLQIFQAINDYEANQNR